MGEYTDEGFRDAIERARSALQPLQDIADAVDWQESVRERIEAQLAAIDSALDELGRVLEDATEEML